jgi:predicted DNA-binding ribbon-helix-helix protein
MIGRRKGGASMAKKKAKKPVGEEPVTVISIKTTKAFRDWVAEVAHAERITVVQLIEKLLAEHGKKMGFKTAPRRTGR